DRVRPEPAGRHVLPVLLRGDAVPARGGRLGMPQLPAGVLRLVPRAGPEPTRHPGGAM
ncbi:MAG: hypothetical protein AVDCRST_MAG48-2360, partial [uncultured Friedmanniella sp.]